MEISIDKEKHKLGLVVVYQKWDDFSWCWGARPNREMTKDLIKQEVRCRVYSFRPTAWDLLIYKEIKRLNNDWREIERFLYNDSSAD